MSNLTYMVDKYTYKQDSFLKKICKPLNDFLGIPFFGYYTISKDGTFGNFSNYPEQIDHFYSENLCYKHPFLAHPHLFRSGYTLLPITSDPYFKEYIWKKYRLEKFFLVLEKNEDTMEGFIFAHENFESKDLIRYLNQLDLLKKFTNYFKREALPLINKIKSEKFNLIDISGDAFYETDQTMPLTNSSLTIGKFLKELTPLTEREQQCLALFKMGNSAQSTAVKLGISQRTVEFYFENIKNKLGVNSKWDLLNF